MAGGAAGAALAAVGVGGLEVDGMAFAASQVLGHHPAALAAVVRVGLQADALAVAAGGRLGARDPANARLLVARRRLAASHQASAAVGGVHGAAQLRRPDPRRLLQQRPAAPGGERAREGESA